MKESIGALNTIRDDAPLVYSVQVKGDDRTFVTADDFNRTLEYWATRALEAEAHLKEIQQGKR